MAKEAQRKLAAAAAKASNSQSDRADARVRLQRARDRLANTTLARAKEQEKLAKVRRGCSAAAALCPCRHYACCCLLAACLLPPACSCLQLQGIARVAEQARREELARIVAQTAAMQEALKGQKAKVRRGEGRGGASGPEGLGGEEGPCACC